jgi:hypothetical protein
MVDQIADLFRTTHKVKTQQVVKNRGQDCGDIDLEGYLANVTGPVPLVLDLRIAHGRVGSRGDPTLNRHLRYPNNLDQSLNDAAPDKIRKYRADYNNNPPSVVSFMSVIASTSGGYIVNLSDYYSYRLIGKLTAFLQLQEFSLHNLPVEDSSTFVVRRSSRVSNLKSKSGNLLAKAAALCINLNLDGAPIASKSHTHPSHSQNFSFVNLVCI